MMISRMHIIDMAPQAELIEHMGPIKNGGKKNLEGGAVRYEGDIQRDRAKEREESRVIRRMHIFVSIVF